MYTQLIHLCKRYQSTTYRRSNGTPQSTPSNLSSSKVKSSGASSISQTELNSINKNLNIVKLLTSSYIFKRKIRLPGK